MRFVGDHTPQRSVPVRAWQPLLAGALAAVLAISCRSVSPHTGADAPLLPEVDAAVQHFLPNEVDRELAADGGEGHIVQYVFHETTAIGPGGAFSAHVRAFRTILESGQADRAFKRLLREAPTAGQLYALCGLYWTDREFFDEAVTRFLADSREIWVQSGCIVFQRPVSDVVAKRSGLSDSIVRGGLPRYFAGPDSRFVKAIAPANRTERMP
jgi:hypothetical protein